MSLRNINSSERLHVGDFFVEIQFHRCAMIFTLFFRRLKDSSIKILRILFEDKEMRGDRFDDLKCSKSGALSVEINDIHASESYKKAREQSDRVLGRITNTCATREKVSDIKIDSFGRISLPYRIRKKITEKTKIEFRELADGRILLVLAPDQ